MQLFRINPNAFQRTLTGEYDEFKKELRTNSNLDEDTAPYINGNILFSISQESNALKELMTTAWNVLRDENESKDTLNKESYHYLDDVTTTIIKSSKSFYLKDALIQIGEIVEALGDKLAGCLLVSGKTIINPLHPLSALVLIDESARIYEQFKIVTYLYTDKRAMHYLYNSSKADMSKIRKNIMLLISLYSNKQEINKVTEVLEVHSTDKDNPLSNIERYYKESISSDSKYDGDFVIIPHQLLTKGIVAPFYGTSVIIREDNTARGALLCPMHSANVSSPLNKDKTRPEFNSICTGSTPKTTMDGLRTLAHANLSSPLHSYNMSAGSILYADECIRQSINMYKLGGFLTKEVKEETPKETADRWGEEDKLFELEEQLERQNLRHEQADAEHEANNAHDDRLDSISYSREAIRRAQIQLSETQRGIFNSMALPTDAFTTGTTFTRIVTNGTTPDEPPYFQPIAADNVYIRPEDTTIRLVDTVNAPIMSDEAFQEMQEEMGIQLGTVIHETIEEATRVAITGENNEQEIEQTEPTTIFADALNEGAAEARAERETREQGAIPPSNLEEEPEQDGYEEQERQREEPVPREELENVTGQIFPEEFIAEFQAIGAEELPEDPADLLEPETEAEQIREQWELTD